MLRRLFPMGENDAVFLTQGHGRGFSTSQSNRLQFILTPLLLQMTTQIP